MHTAKEILSYLSEIPDPEIPVISIVDLGMVRDVSIHCQEVEVSITPTYTGCPAMKMITDEIVGILKTKGIKQSRVKMVYSPAWSTDCISEAAKARLKEYGIAPPEKKQGHNSIVEFSENRPRQCPFCNSTDTRLESEFGSTLCKALYHCNNCKQPFEAFKCI